MIILERGRGDIRGEPHWFEKMGSMDPGVAGIARDESILQGEWRLFLPGEKLENNSTTRCQNKCLSCKQTRGAFAAMI